MKAAVPYERGDDQSHPNLINYMIKPNFLPCPSHWSAWFRFLSKHETNTDDDSPHSVRVPFEFDSTDLFRRARALEGNGYESTIDIRVKIRDDDFVVHFLLYSSKWTVRRPRNARYLGSGIELPTALSFGYDTF